jgi:hypothetical protein
VRCRAQALADRAAAIYGLAIMTARETKGGDPARAKRLAAALRDNLKRRKAQAKSRAQAVGEKPRETGRTISEIAPDRLKG